MTQDTRAEKLRQLIDSEESSSRRTGNHGFAYLPLTAHALKVFLERLHAHETRIGKYHIGCYMCQTADEMIKEFS